MDGIHDLGGMQGFGPVSPTPAERPFHEPWEGRTHGLMITSVVATGGGSLRPFIERMGNAAYLATSYYEHWLAGVEARLVADGTVTDDDLARWRAALTASATVPVRHDPEAAAFVRSLFRPFAVEDPDGPLPHFEPGDEVRVRRMHPTGHTRCPRYVRGATGTVALVHSAQPLPDVVDTDGARAEPFYTVSFHPTELWGDDVEPGKGSIRVDLWESYLDAQPEAT